MLDLIPIEEDITVLCEYREDFELRYENIEKLALHLEQRPDDTSALDKLTSTLDELIKGAISCNVAPLVEPLELMLATIEKTRSGGIRITNFCETILLFMDRFLDIARDAAEKQRVSFNTIQRVQEAVTTLARISSTDDVEPAIQAATRILLGEFVSQDDFLPDVELFSDDSYVKEKAIEIEPIGEIEERALSLHRLLADTIDARHKYWHGRTGVMLSMALGMNALKGNAVDIDQFEAAICLHDFPMTRLSDETLYANNLTTEQKKAIREHPMLAYELALTIDDRSETARIVYQHHERPDGKGYPEGVKGDSICDGAKIIAICDAFFSMTHAQAHKANRRSILRAIAEINACIGTQFDPMWVQQFNVVVRTERISGSI